MISEMKEKVKSDIESDIETDLISKKEDKIKITSIDSDVDFEENNKNKKTNKNNRSNNNNNKNKQQITFINSDEKEGDILSEKDILNYISTFNKLNSKNSSKFIQNYEQSSSDDSTSWKILETIRAPTPEISASLSESSSDGMSSIYSSVPIPLPIPIMMQVPMQYSSSEKDIKSSCMKMVDMCKDPSVMSSKYSNEATGGGSKGKEVKENKDCQGMDKKQMMDMIHKMEEMMNKTMKSYMDNMMSSKVDKAMKMVMKKMKSTPAPVMPGKMKPNYMASMMMNMMDYGKKSSSSKSNKCPPCDRKSENKLDGMYEQEVIGDSGGKDSEKDSSYSSDEKGNEGEDEGTDDAYIMDSMKEVMKEVMNDFMKDTVSQVMSTFPPMYPE